MDINDFTPAYASGKPLHLAACTILSGKAEEISKRSLLILSLGGNNESVIGIQISLPPPAERCMLKIRGVPSGLVNV